MTAVADVVAGAELTSRRTVSPEDVAAVARITGDEGMHHVSGLAGRQVAQGLLTVAFAPLLKTEAGFRLDTAEVTFLAPVFVGDTVACSVTVGSRDGDTVAFTLRIANQDGAEVAVGQGTGTIAPAPAPGAGAGPSAGDPPRLLTAEVLADPYPTYAELQRTRPVYWADELHGWVVTGYDDVYGALRDHGRFSSDRIDRLLGSRVPPEALKIIAPFVALASRWMWMVDPPDHTRVRRTFNHGFTPRAVRRLRPLVEETVGDLLDAVVDRGSMDLIADFAYPLPATVLADVYGIPRADAPLLKEWSDAMKVFIGGTPDLAAMAGPAADSMREMMAYFTAVIADRRGNPRDDLVSALVHADEAEPLDPDSLCANLVLVLAASYATTQDMIGNGMLGLLRQRAEWHRLQGEPGAAARRHRRGAPLRRPGPADPPGGHRGHRPARHPDRPGRPGLPDAGGGQPGPAPVPGPGPDRRRPAGHRARRLRRRHPLLHRRRAGPGRGRRHPAGAAAPDAGDRAGPGRAGRVPGGQPAVPRPAHAARRLPRRGGAMTAAATVTALLDRAAADFPAAAVGFPQDGTRLPLGRLAGSAAAVAGGLARLGTGPGRRVGVLFGTEPDFLPALFGILRTGAAVCPLPLPTAARDLPAYLDRLTGIVTAAGLTHVVVSDRLGELEPPLAAALGVPLLHPAELAGAGGPAPADRADPEDPAILQFTSGSTAAPKGVVLPHRAVVAGLDAINRGAGMDRERDSGAVWLPLYHDMGLFGTLAAVSIGMPVDLWSPAYFVRHPDRWLAAVAAAGHTVCPLPNFAYDQLVDCVPAAEMARLDLSRWRVAFNGAESISVASVRDLPRPLRPGRGFRPAAMTPAYGMAKATLLVTLPPLEREPLAEWVDRAAPRRRPDGRCRCSEGAPGARGIVATRPGRRPG